MFTEFTRNIQKLARNKKIKSDSACFGIRKNTYIWNRQDSNTAILDRVLAGTDIEYVLLAYPDEPFLSIIKEIISYEKDTINLRDSESRMFLGDIPIMQNGLEDIAPVLSRYHTIILSDGRILTSGAGKAQQVFVRYSSLCFAVLVKYFLDFIKKAQSVHLSLQDITNYKRIQSFLSLPGQTGFNVRKGPYCGGEEVLAAIIDTGKAMAEAGFVDSFFGNISYRHQDLIYISETGVPLDELSGHIAITDMKGNILNGLLPSSEYSSHKAILSGERRAVLHGHPCFSVILSMFCDTDNCANPSECYRRCSASRSINDIPVVHGETGDGEYGLSRAVPGPLESVRGVIVYGHGVFAADNIDFTNAFDHIREIESNNYLTYTKLVNNFISML